MTAVPTTVDPTRLYELLVAAGVAPLNGLFLVNGEAYTFVGGVWVDLPASAVTVITNYTPPTPVPIPNFGTDDTPRAQVADTVTQLRAYLGVASPTLAQSGAALKLTIRAVLFLAKLLIQW